MRSLRVNLLPGLLLSGLVVLSLSSPRVGAGGKDGEEPVSAEKFTKVYADSPADFDKKYKGKSVTVEGVVTGTGVKGFVPAGQPAGKSFLMIEGYAKPGSPAPNSVRCEESGPDFEGIRPGHKVRVRGTAQGHSPTSFAAELRECKVVQVFAEDYPPSKGVREEIRKLQGKWNVVGGEAAGLKIGTKQAGFDALTFEGYTVSLHKGTSLLQFGVAVNPDKTPRQMDLTGGKMPLPCIYALEGGQLRLALPTRGPDGGLARPETLDTSKSKGLVLIGELQKQASDKKSP